MIITMMGMDTIMVTTTVTVTGIRAHTAIHIRMAITTIMAHRVVVPSP